jgi:putative phage-type endonuclease
MRIIDCVQGSPEWHLARCGVPTASSFDLIITTKGEPSKQRLKYLYKLAGEQITGIAEETYQNGAMLRGKELEAEARKLYEFMSGETVQEVGFCVVDGDYAYGASPDGLVGEDGNLEIKCPSLSVHVGYLLDNKLPTDYFQQTQGQLLVTGRKFCDFISYYPGMKPLLIRVKPDKDFHKVLKTELEKFCVELKQVVEKIR